MAKGTGSGSLCTGFATVQPHAFQAIKVRGEPGTVEHIRRAFMITIESRQAHKPVAYKHEGEELILVMDGELQLTLGSKTHHVKPGESIHFNSEIPHKLKSLSDEPTRCVVVLYTP